MPVLRVPAGEPICHVLYDAAQKLNSRNHIALTAQTPVVIVQNHDTAMELVKGRQPLHKNLGAITALMGKSRLSSDDPDWRALRDLSQRHIASLPAERIAEVSQRHYRAAIASMDAPDANLDACIDLAAARTSLELLFDVPGERIEGALVRQIGQLLVTLQDINWQMAEDAAARSPTVVAQCETVRAAATALFRMAPQDGRNALITNLRALDDPTDEIVTLLISAYETTATCIQWTLFLLAGAADEQDAIRSAAPDARSRGITAAIREALRIFPPVPLLGRMTTGPVEIDGQSLPAGTTVVISVVGAHCDRQRHPAPLAFCPRTEAEDAQARQGDLAFGGGRRICPGRAVAMQEAEIAVDMILSAFRLSRSPDPASALSLGIGMRSRNGTGIRLERLHRQTDLPRENGTDRQATGVPTDAPPGTSLLQTDHLVLRPMRTSDASGPFRAMFAAPEIMNAMNLPARLLTEAELAAYIEGFDGQRRVLMGVWERGTETFCGFWTVTVDHVQRTATLDMALDRRHPRCGLFALESTLAIGQWLHRSGLEKLVAHVLVENRRAARLFQRIGMRHEGTLRGELRDLRGGNGRVDLLRFGALRDDLVPIEARIKRLIARSKSLSGKRFAAHGT